MKTTLIIVVILLLAAFLAPVSAVTPHGRRVTGTIKKVDAAKREVEMLADDTNALVTFTWNSQTSFVANAKFTDAAILRAGARVEVVRHVPFFGSPFVTKVTLQTNRQTKPTKQP